MWHLVACTLTFSGALKLQVAVVLAEATGLSLLWSNISVLLFALLLISPLLAWSGALFNPTANVALLFSGHGQWSHNALRMVCQLVGAVIGSSAAVAFLPTSLQTTFPELSGSLLNGTDMQQACVSEAGLSFVLNCFFLYSLAAKGSFNTFWLPMAATAGIVSVGSHYTGPSLNPAISLAWHLQHQKHSQWEHIVVYTVAPLVGAMFAGLLFSAMKSKAAKPVKVVVAAKNKDL
ncbi:MAG: hypothetical protein WDW38_005100 [Sanguina aurantia]